VGEGDRQTRGLYLIRIAIIMMMMRRRRRSSVGEGNVQRPISERLVGRAIAVVVCGADDAAAFFGTFFL